MASTDKIVDIESEDQSDFDSIETQLVSWVVALVREWEDHRDSNYESRWNEYYRLWRGVWKEEDRTRETERSRLISPATAQAVEVATAEIEEAIFGKGKWFDVSDDVRDDDKADMMVFRNKLLEDLTENGYPRAIAEIVLNGAIYGTGIGKIVVEHSEERSFDISKSEGLLEELEAIGRSEMRTRIKLVAVEPRDFVIDPAATTIDEAMGCAHVFLVPKHIITSRMQSGMYRQVSLGTYHEDFDHESKGEVRTGLTDHVKLTQYHGLVPEMMLHFDADPENEDIFSVEEGEGSFDESEVMIEAIITIANDGVLLKATATPHFMQDRDFVSFQYDTVPNRFWGRGVAEKGYNPQKALDAELRGRIDAMSLTIHPMIGIDATRVPRGGDFSVRPGKSILTNGNPSEVLNPFRFGEVSNNTFSEAGDLERMIQMATGAMDSATPIAQNSRNNTLGGMSIMQAGAIKRSKRTLANIEASFLKPLIQKSAWRYIQYAPDEYAQTDPRFVVNSTLGIMARELEMQQLAGLLASTQGDSVGYWMLMKSIYELSSASNREEMMGVADRMLQQAQNPPPDPLALVKQAELEHTKERDLAKLQIEQGRANTEARRVGNEEAKLEGSIAKTDAETRLAETRSESLRRTTIVETDKEVAIQKNKTRELELKEDELALKKRDQEIKLTLSQNEILAEKDLLERELRAKAAEQESNEKSAAASKPAAPVINIVGSGKKKIAVKRTADGLEGTSEEI